MHARARVDVEYESITYHLQAAERMSTTQCNRLPKVTKTHLALQVSTPVKGVVGRGCAVRRNTRMSTRIPTLCTRHTATALEVGCHKRGKQIRHSVHVITQVRHLLRLGVPHMTYKGRKYTGLKVSSLSAAETQT